MGAQILPERKSFGKQKAPSGEPEGAKDSKSD
jgi:hypothetical protein